MPWDDDVMVPDGVGEEVSGFVRSQFYYDLGAAKIVFVLISQ